MIKMTRKEKRDEFIILVVITIIGGFLIGQAMYHNGNDEFCFAVECSTIFLEGLALILVMGSPFIIIYFINWIALIKEEKKNDK